MKAKDLAGFRFGKLTVICRSGTSKSGDPRWRCLCDCEKVVDCLGSNLRSGHTRSCGCSRGSAAEDLAGQTFGLLTAIRIHSRKDGKVRWFCQCECGGTAIVISSNLKNGNSKSCGCLSSEVQRRTFPINPALKSSVVNNRLRAGWNENDARRLPVRPRHSPYQKPRHPSVSAHLAASRRFGGWSDVEARMTPKGKSPYRETYDRHPTVSPGLAYARRQLGWPPDLASKTPKGVRLKDAVRNQERAIEADARFNEADEDGWGVE